MDGAATNMEHDAAPDGEIPSCQGCRRRKLRCSRDRPKCSHCQRSELPCVYDLKKNKPGMKPGAIESLNRRVEALENALLNNKPSTQDHDASSNANVSGGEGLDSSQNVVGVLSLLARELTKLNSNSKNASNAVVSPHSESDHAVLSPVTTVSGTVRASDGRNVVSHPHNQPRKRRRVDSCGNPNIGLVTPLGDLRSIAASLPPPDLLEDIITVYFNIIQPWIPILHETQFRRRVYDQEQSPRLVVVLHAMVVACVRFVESRMSMEEIEAWMTRSRNIVVLNAMDQLSVESLQALSIIAFTDIGNGSAPRAWSIVGSLTRTVEYLQLSIERSHPDKEHLLKPLPSIPEPKNWTEEEERRRVFWNIFNLDRFCSVTTGWNTSLTSDDVHRRLPADGGTWHKEEPVVTPYFGIWDRSAAKIGNSIAFLPAHFPSPGQTVETPTHSESSAAAAAMSPQGVPFSVDMTTVGAFAYCIEATESLSRVTTYFLQQKINFQDRQEVSNWLTRFKELDLRLVHWKMFLPQKWKDSNISRQPALINMDPNLTLAHVTHNTSMVLLHQRIAYPEPRWSTMVRLPSACSAETCQNAAVETTTITQKYLRYTPDNSPVNSQFSFCAFISARVLLIHWRYYRTELAPEFWYLVRSLDEMAARWIGQTLQSKQTSLAGTYAAQLRQLHHLCESNPDFTIDVFGYTGESFDPSDKMRQDSSAVVAQNNGDAVTSNPDQPTTHLQQQERGITSPIGNSFNTMQPIPQIQEDGVVGPLGSGLQLPVETPTGREAPDELSAISHVLMDQHFMRLDRVISFDDMMFTAQTAGPNGNCLPLDGWPPMDGSSLE